MDYKKTRLKETCSVSCIITVHYFEYGKSYRFSGEAHNFWELIYVDRGEVNICSDSEWSTLRQGEIAFHKPDEFHNISANGKVAPNLVIIAFCCESDAMSFFKDYRSFLNEREKNLLSVIVKEATDAFSSPIGNPDLKKMERRKAPLQEGCEQMIKISLEQLLIMLIRDRMPAKQQISNSSKTGGEDLSKRVIAFLEKNTDKNLKFSEICSEFKISATGLKTIFKNITGSGVMEYHRKLRIKKAKILIRESGLNFTQIADILGYESIHRFSRQFKKVTGMSPTEYSKTIER